MFINNVYMNNKIITKKAYVNCGLLFFVLGQRRLKLIILHFNVGPLSFNYENFDGNLPTFLLNPYSWTKVCHHILLYTVSMQLM